MDFSLEKKSERERQKNGFNLRFEFTIVNKSSVPILVVQAQWLWKTLWSPKCFRRVADIRSPPGKTQML